MTKKKLLIIAAANNFHFIRDIAEMLQNDFEVELFEYKANSLSEREMWSKIFFASVVWLEWADTIPIHILKGFRSFNLTRKKIIVRLHRYELFTPRTLKLIQEVTDSGAYKNIDKLVFVSEAVRQIGISKFPWMKNSVVIPNLFDHTKFPFHNRDKGYNLLFLGRISYVKNLPLCLTMFHELLKLDSNYKLHIVGNISDPELIYYAENFIAKTKLDDNIVWRGHVPHEKIPALMADMHYIICSSIFESQGMGIIEGMASGLKPVIFDFPGAEQFYPEKWRWTDRTDFIGNILSPDYDPQEYHDYVVKNYSIEQNVWRYKELIEGIMA